MSDVEIVFPQGREAVVRRLRDALAEAGYDIGTREVGEGDGAPAASDAAAILILWDRSTMAHPGLQAVAATARNRDRAIDVSVDGITPLGLDDDRGLVQLSGWRGDPHHPGWRKILQRLDRLCRPRREAAAARPAVAAPAAGRTAADRAAASRTPRKAWAAAAIVLLLIVVVAGVLTSRRGPSPAPGAAPPAAPPAAAEPQAPPAAARQSSSTAPATPAAPGSGEETGGSPGAAVPAPQSQSALPPETRAASGAAAPSSGAARPERTAKAASAPPKARAKAVRAGPKPGVHYTRYSRNMRLFCERAGRRTRECRAFNAAAGQ